MMRLLRLRLGFLAATTPILFGLSVAAGSTINVRDYGAVGDGTHNDTSAIQSALDSGANNVVIPAGTYSINQTLLIGSNTTVQADPNAMIRLANGANTLLINNRPNASNITLQGGIWDGNNQYNQRGANSDPNPYSGCAINFFGVDHLTISDLTVRNPDSFGIRIGTVQNFAVRNVALDYTAARLNQDGVHVNGNSHHGVISGIRAVSPNTPNDDMVALNADDTRTMTEALVRGQQNGPISDVLVENLRADNAYTFVRLYSNSSRLENVTLRDIKGGFRYYAINMDNHDFPVGAGDIRDVTIDDCSVTKTAADLAWAPVVDIGLQVQNLHFTTFVRGDNPSTAATPTLVLRNGLSNVIQFADGSQQEVQNYTLQQGGLGDFWLNPAPAPEPSTCALLATAVLGLLCHAWRRHR
jgi:polygalacturonase